MSNQDKSKVQIPEDLYRRAYANIDKLNNGGGSILIEIDRVNYYFVADFGQHLTFINAHIYEGKHRNKNTPIDFRDCIDITDSDRRALSIYQQLANKKIDRNIIINF